MARKKIKAALEAKKIGIRKWTFEWFRNQSGFYGSIKDENGRTVMPVVEDIDYNTLSRILNTAKYMSNEHDMKGLARYVWDRNLVPMNPEEKEEWRRKKTVPVEIKEIRL